MAVSPAGRMTNLVNPAVEVGVELTVQLRPVERDDLGRIEVRPAPLHRGSQPVRYRTVTHREVDAEVVGFDYAAGLLRRPAQSARGHDRLPAV